MVALADDFVILEQQLNAPIRAERLAAARALGSALRAGRLPRPVPTVEVNNHVHTCYSFSPYSPTLAAWQAQQAGLRAVGIMDHDSVAGVEEMLEAGALLGIHTTAGFELRVSFADTPMAGRVLNAPGMPNIAYIAIHGIPAAQLMRCSAFLTPIQAVRNARNRAMLEKLNAILHALRLPVLDFQHDIYAQSYAAEGGAITERHLLAALARRMMDTIGIGDPLVDFLDQQLHLSLSPRVREYLRDVTGKHYLYDLLGVLKAEYADAFFLQPSEAECLPVKQVLTFAEEIGAISAYAYLGDVGESPTGDKKAEAFEDAFLDALMFCLRQLGFRAVTYMPPRNTPAQLARIGELCDEYDFMQISGVDINSSRQSFTCPEIRDPRFAHLLIATWALIGHEKASATLPGYGLFSTPVCARISALHERLALFSAIGQAINPYSPTSLPAVAAPLRALTAG